MGDARVLFESDFPHPDSKFPHASETFLSLLPEQIGDDSKRRILWDNPLEFYRFPDEYIPSELIEGAASAGT
jgi:predicted TIM-barrel fold metal-dependent hydrolase